MLLAGCQECRLAPGLTAAQCTELEGLARPAALPPSPGNALADDVSAAVLGHAVFFDARLSANQDVRCATCHVPERFFSDGQPTAQGLERGTRNSPSLLTAAWHRWQTWDGRADSLWSQPILAFENPKEMDFTRLELAHRVAHTYRAQYEALFGGLPPLGDAQRFPPRGKPGDAAFDGMRPEDQVAVNEVAANLGKALEAYQRKLSFTAGRFDDFVAGHVDALTPPEREGARVFFTAGCATCHSGPLLSDDAFHALGHTPERGRAEALEHLALSPFTAAGAFWDGEPRELPRATPADEGAFRTPSLRNVSRTGPWGHDGALETLEAAVDSHLPPGVASGERDALLAFLRALQTGDPPSPWNNWPNR